MEIQGLMYKKIDLHIHTPGSRDFRDRKVAPQDIIEKAIEEGLDAIAITDHNTAEWVDKVKEAADQRLAVFPGIEISATSGKSGTVHLIGIFDRSKTSKDIENLLGALGIKADEYGKEKAFTKSSPSQVIDIIAEREGLPILAHANSNHGVMNDMAGNPRIETIQNQRLIAVEATDVDDEEKKKKGKRIIDLLNGEDPHYRRRLAVYQASDAHSLGEIGSRYTYFKLDEISLEGLRQCSCDPNVRIKQKNEFEMRRFPKLIRMKIDQGFLGSQEVCFHEGLNSIIGGKGVGKSLMVEFLRFALDQPSQDESILRDHRQKLEKRLEFLGEVMVEFELESGDRYQVKRKYNETGDEAECINMRTNEAYAGRLSELFPVLAYSQNEIIKIAEDEQAQLRLIDSFIGTSSFERDIQILCKQLKKEDKELAKSINASSEVASLKTDLNTITEKLKNINRSLANSLFEKMKSWEKKKKTIESYLSFQNALAERINQFESDLTDEKAKYFNEEEISDDPQIEKAKSLCDNSSRRIFALLEDADNELIKSRERMSEISADFMLEFEERKKLYEEMLKEAGGDKKKLENERRKQEKKKQDVKEEMKVYTKDLEKLDENRNRRNELLDELDKAHDEYYLARKKKYDDLTAQFEGKLKLELFHGENKNKFKEELLSFKKGTRIHEPDIERISQRLRPRELVDLIIDNDADSLAEKAKIANENARKLIEKLNSMDALEDILALCYEAYPEDIPSITFRKEDGNYDPLHELSVGQKCTALLIIALSEGVRPIIIDQPEDSLDIPSIYEDIVSKLRLTKEKRQFILTTHNSSVSVASDSDKFIILRSSAAQGDIECCGAIDRKEVRQEVIRHLEGGADPYKLKNKKYNIQ